MIFLKEIFLLKYLVYISNLKTFSMISTKSNSPSDSFPEESQFLNSNLGALFRGFSILLFLLMLET